MKSVLGFECSQAVKIAGVIEGDIQGAVLSQFGVMAAYIYREHELRFHDLVNGTHLKIGGFTNTTRVAWYKSDMVTLTSYEPFVRRASYMSLLECPYISTFKTFNVSKSIGWPNFQLAQYTGKILCALNRKLATFDLETGELGRTEIDLIDGVNTGCVLPEGMLGLVNTVTESFFVDEHGERAENMGSRSVCFETILSSSDPGNLDRALVRGGHWYVPGRREYVRDNDFKEQTGWNGNQFVRLIDDVFLFRQKKEVWGSLVYEWYIIRVHVP